MVISEHMPSVCNPGLQIANVSCACQVVLCVKGLIRIELYIEFGRVSRDRSRNRPEDFSIEIRILEPRKIAKEGKEGEVQDVELQLRSPEHSI
jgi:hypothetical protein